MENHFKIKLITEGDYRAQAFDVMQTCMQNQFMYPAKQSESNLIIKGFYDRKSNIYLDVKQNVGIFRSLEHLIEVIKKIYRIDKYEIGFTQEPESFFNEFIYSGTPLVCTNGGKEKLINIVTEMITCVTDAERDLDVYDSLISAHNKVLLSNHTPDDFYEYLVAITNFTHELDRSSSLAFLKYEYKLKCIHTDKYTAQEHFKEIVKPVHLRLKSFGFKKTALKFIQHDIENGIERVIWLQKSMYSQKNELTFVINFCIRPAGSYTTMYERSGYLFEPKRDSWFMVNISIDTVKTIEILLMHIDKILEVIMDCNSVEEYNEFTEKIRKEAMQARK